jgi:hypothetical protein
LSRADQCRVGEDPVADALHEHARGSRHDRRQAMAFGRRQGGRVNGLQDPTRNLELAAPSPKLQWLERCYQRWGHNRGIVRVIL